MALRTALLAVALCVSIGRPVEARWPPLWDEEELVRSGPPQKDIGDLMLWEISIAEQAAAQWNSTVYVVFTDSAFYAAFDNLVASASRFMGLLPIIVALDDETEEYFHTRRLPVARFKPAPWSKGTLRSQALRYVLAYRFLLHGLRVLYADIDVFLAGNPLLWDDGDKDVQVEPTLYDEEVCSGFFLAKPRDSTLLMFRAVIAWIHKHMDWITVGDNHQLVLDYALRQRRNILLPGDAFSDEQMLPLRGHGTRWAFLPTRQFMHYTAPRHLNAPVHLPRLGDVYLGESPVVAVHIWTSGGPSSTARILLACMLGFWSSHLPPSGPNPPSADICNWCNDGWGNHIPVERYEWCSGRATIMPAVVPVRVVHRMSSK